jgi:hypothetical protein
MSKRQYFRQVLAAIHEGRKLCERYKSETGGTACIIERLDKLEEATRRRLENFDYSEPIGRPHWNEVHRGLQLVDLIRQDEDERARLRLASAVLANPWGC